MATKVPGLKNSIYVEDVETGAAASEATMNKFGASVNKLLDEVWYSLHWIANGSYWITSSPEYSMDKELLVPFDCEIVKIRVYNKTAGTSGTSECDIEKRQLAGSWSTIFTTRPKIPFSSGANAQIITQHLPTTSTIYASAGTTVPVLASTQLSANDVLRFNFLDKQAKPSEGFGIELVLRSR